MDEIRKQFEVWAARQGYDVERWYRRDREYTRLEVCELWSLWKADSSTLISNMGKFASAYGRAAAADGATCVSVPAAGRSGKVRDAKRRLLSSIALAVGRYEAAVAPTAQVDLEQFRDAVLDQYAHVLDRYGRHEELTAAEAERDRLLALIDAQSK